MTGGYELVLRADLGESELVALGEMHLTELQSYKPGDSRYRSNNSFRILGLLLEEEHLPETLRKRIVEVHSISR